MLTSYMFGLCVHLIMHLMCKLGQLRNCERAAHNTTFVAFCYYSISALNKDSTEFGSSSVSLGFFT